MVDATKNDKAPLEDLMAAMDVVDTLRHDQSIAERELDGEGRRERLLERLRGMYAAQGIEVPDHVLEEGIDALEQERFQYTPVKPSWQTKMARLWVSRSRWGKPLGFFAVVAAAFYGYYFVSDVMPLRALKADLPSEISRSLQQISASSKNPEITAQARLYAANAERAIANEDYDEAQDIVANMQTVQRQLGLEYDIRVISRANENSGVFRNPPGNVARNYYLIVEAIDKNNRVVELTIVNQENNKAAQKKTWGLRVNEETFYKIASDKRDDGIIQNNKVGRKLAGYLKPEFSIPTTGATITEW
jgi:hypothetical protein